MGFFTDLTLNRAKERAVDREDLRPERDEAHVGVGVILEPGWRTQIELALTRSDWSYSDPNDVVGEVSISDVLDRREDGTLLRAGYELAGRTDLTLDAWVKTIDFDHAREGGAGPEDQDSREWQVLPGVRFRQGGALSGSARVGHAEIDAADPARPDFSDVVGEAALAYRLNSRTTLRLEGRRLPGFALFEDSTYFLDTSWSLRGVYFWSRSFGVESGGSRGRLTFPGSPGAGGREDRTRSHDVGVRVRLAENTLGRRVEYTLRLGRYRRDSELSSLDQSRTTVSLGAVVGF
jgi:hypothetical protein